jgi:glucosamine--fructose-6-phosphate aminotransferase (isomerizing)
MCGIVAYYGKRRVPEVLLDCLQRLEYRGYDSAGIALWDNGNIEIIKAIGKIKDLRAKVDINRFGNVRLGIGHTRWATHGVVSNNNAHPHKVDKISLVHNGIVENYLELKKMLSKNNCNFFSETDSEIVAHLIANDYRGDLLKATVNIVKNLKGSFALAIISALEPDTIVLVKKENPLIIGIGCDEIFVASDITALFPYTDTFIFLDDENIVKINKCNIEVFDFFGNNVSLEKKKVKINFQLAEKAGYKHYMIKEIFEQPKALIDTLVNYISSNREKIIFNELNQLKEVLAKTNSIHIIGCGTSYHAAMVGKYLIERYAGTPVSVDIASEFRYRNNVFCENSIFIAISQSGETADTLASVRQVKKNGVKVIAISNVFSSSLSRLSDATIYTYAGPEIGVASTKAFTTQLLVLLLLALYLGQIKQQLTNSQIQDNINDIVRMPEMLDTILKMTDIISELAMKSINYKHFFYLGRNINYPIALEGALKLKEVSYIHAEGYAAGELKHGPIALISKEMPVFVIASKSHTYEKILSNIEEIRARNGIIYAIATEGDLNVKHRVDEIIYLPDIPEGLSIFLNTVVFQLFAYHCANFLGLDVDQPRNLAKSVTVE